VLSAFLDGESGPAAAREVAAHLRDCPACRSRALTLEAARAPEEPPGPDCPALEVILGAADGTAGTARVREVEAHLRGCGRCRLLAAGARRAAAEAKEAESAAAAPPGLREEARRLLERAGKKVVPFPEPGPAELPRAAEPKTPYGEKPDAPGSP